MLLFYYIRRRNCSKKKTYEMPLRFHAAAVHSYLTLSKAITWPWRHCRQKGRTWRTLFSPVWGSTRTPVFLSHLLRPTIWISSRKMAETYFSPFIRNIFFFFFLGTFQSIKPCGGYAHNSRNSSERQYCSSNSGQCER